jgi:hypothetical protein
VELVGDQTEDALAVTLGGVAAVAGKAWALWGRLSGDSDRLGVGRSATGA